MRAIRALRLGSYSISATRPGIPNLSRLKSILRYCRLCPPPRCREVRWPWLFRPPDFFIGSSSDFSRVSRVISSNPDTERKRVPAVMGRNCLMLISALEYGDRIAVLERHDCLLPALGGALDPPPGDRMPPHLHGADPGDGHREHRLNGGPDLVLVGLGVHLEGVLLARLVGRRALLGDHRTDHDLVQRGHLLVPLLLLRRRLLGRLARRFLGGGLLG